MNRVKLLVSFLAWRYLPKGGPNMAHLKPSESCRCLLAGEELYRHGPGVVRDRFGKLWKCPDSFLEDGQ